jgi:hypothetical protein
LRHRCLRQVIEKLERFDDLQKLVLWLFFCLSASSHAPSALKPELGKIQAIPEKCGLLRPKKRPFGQTTAAPLEYPARPCYHFSIRRLEAARRARKTASWKG